MGESATIAGRVLEAVSASGLVTYDQLEAARSATSSDGTCGRSLIERGLVTPDQLEKVLEESMGIPRVDLASYAPEDEALALVPAAVARFRGVLPLFEIEGMLTVAMSDPVDIFALDELSADLGLEVEPVLSDGVDVHAAIRQYYGEGAVVEATAEDTIVVGIPPREDIEISAADFFEVEDEPETIAVVPTAAEVEAEPELQSQTVLEVVEAEAPQGPAGIDLDVLAVADDRKLALLVADVLEQAVSRGASRIHVFPYKSDFFLVYRVKGRLEKVASAPLSLQGPLIEGFKAWAKLGQVPADVPALGRLNAEIAGHSLVVTVSSVPTVAGQRLVVTLSQSRPEPRGLVDLGTTDAESRALEAMIERGRGILLVASPVAGGRSSTYYSLLQHAASSGRTVYSVERSIEYEIPAVAQVLVNPGSPVGAASYFAAGMRQDTDVMAIDSMQSVEDVHLAIEAAGMGKLVIATFAGADIASAVSRMLALGAEPVSLGSALTLAVAQRIVRTNCPNCSSDEKTSLSDLIPGAERGMTTRRGTGCPNCGKTGFSGATGIFEVLPFTEPVRAQVARGAGAEQISAAATAAGMRPMVASGLAKVRDGLVSAEELDRVLRFSG
ncbi:MAG: Flp pilus assembly complex ATPase component TadA [Coriobacteriia bacterium]|nr:Flp pilus assembly complex ATPase component TadA [Coriobacteriia bacterium]